MTALCISVYPTRKISVSLNETFSTKYKVSLIRYVTEGIFNSVEEVSERKTSVFLRMEIILFGLGQKCWSADCNLCRNNTPS